MVEHQWLVYTTHFVMNNSTQAFFSVNDIQLSVPTLQRLQRLQQFARQNQRRFNKLSKREKEVLSLICRDFKNEDIARHLYLSVHTVRTHRNNIWRTLGISSIVEAIFWAQAFDLV